MLTHHAAAEGNLRGSLDAVQNEMEGAADILSETISLDSFQIESSLDGDDSALSFPVDEEDPLAALDNAEYSTEFENMKRIIGGTVVAPGKWLGLGMTMQKGSNGQYLRGKCGAILIAPRWALSAAHCISNVSTGDMARYMQAVYFNPYTPWYNNNGNQPYQIINIKKMIEHPLHKPGMGSSWDFLLLELEKDAHPTIQRGIPSLADSSYIASLRTGNTMEIAGMGQTKYQGGSSQYLQEAQVPFVEWNRCKSTMGQWGNFHETMICAGGDGDTDTCGGDSGGPMMHNGVLTGVVSWGYKCGVKGYPGVYGNIAKALPWIEKTISGVTPGQSVRITSVGGGRVTRVVVVAPPPILQPPPLHILPARTNHARMPQGISCTMIRWARQTVQNAAKLTPSACAIIVCGIGIGK